MDIIGRFKGRKVVVYGDFVADRYVYGDIERVSREAPVLILKQVEEKIVPGSAGNTVMNIAALGGEPVPVGILGGDPVGVSLRKIFENRGIGTEFINTDKNAETVTKTRILGGLQNVSRQQVVRLDSGRGYGDADRGPMKKNLKKALAGAECAVISDYDCGTVRVEDFEEFMGGGGIKSVLDSRHNLLSYRGVTSATPNEEEVEEALGIDLGREGAVDEAGGRILGEIGAEAVLITRGKRGMSLFRKDGGREDIPIFGSDDITDVTGAGDTVISAYSLALAAGADYGAAARTANCAGGLVVMKKGTAVVTLEELEGAVKRYESAIKGAEE